MLNPMLIQQEHLLFLVILSSFQPSSIPPLKNVTKNVLYVLYYTLILIKVHNLRRALRPNFYNATSVFSLHTRLSSFLGLYQLDIITLNIHALGVFLFLVVENN